MYSNIVQILISPTLTAKWDIWLSIISSILSPRDLEMNHMPGSSNSLFNNSTRPYTIYCYRWMPYKWFIVCFPCSTQSFFCCKIKSYMQCYFWYRVFSQNLPNKTKHCWVKNQIMYLFLFSCFRIFVPRFHWKWDILIPVCSSIRLSDRQSVYLSFIQFVTQSGLWVSAINFHILTLYGLY